MIEDLIGVLAGLLGGGIFALVVAIAISSMPFGLSLLVAGVPIGVAIIIIVWAVQRNE